MKVLNAVNYAVSAANFTKLDIEVTFIWKIKLIHFVTGFMIVWWGLGIDYGTLGAFFLRKNMVPVFR